MRFINLTTFTPTDEWIDIANQHTAIIIPLTRPQRTVYVNDSINKWWNNPEFLDSLKEHGKRKCWYSESKSEVQLYVDHFRPKLLVTRITGSYNYPETGTRPLRNGYYWLTYNYQNFRITSNISNARKGGYFPLATHSPSVEIYPTGDISPEIFMLLDPCVAQDVNLLMYNLIEPKPTYDIIEDEYNYHRAAISVMAYNLEDSLFKTLRFKTFKMCKDLLSEAEISYNDENWIQFSIKCSKLVDMLSPEAEFSTMTKHFLTSLDEDWLIINVLDEARNLNFI